MNGKESALTDDTDRDSAIINGRESSVKLSTILSGVSIPNLKKWT